MSSEKKSYMRWVWIIVALVVYLIIAYVPNPTAVVLEDGSLSVENGLTATGLKALGLMVAAVITWISGCIPTTMSVFFFIFAAAFPGVGLYESAAAATKAGMNPTVLFVAASFILAFGISDSGLGKRMAYKMALMSKGKPARAATYIICCCSFLSMFISDVPAVATFVPISVALAEANGCIVGKSNFGKMLFIGIALAALIGGMGTPAGSSMNILALDSLRSNFDVTVTFLQWTIIGVPVVIICTAITCILLKFIFKPEFSEMKGMAEIGEEYKAMGKFSKNEKTVVIVFILMVACWLCGGQNVPVLGSMEVSTIAIIGGLIFFVPGTGFLTWDGCKSRIGWDVVMLMMGANVLGGALQSSGAAAWIANSLLGGLASLSPFVLIFIICLFTYAVHVICPVNPALVGILVPCLGSLALTMGQAPGYLCIPMAFTVSLCLLTIYDPVPLISYEKGYFSQGDYFKAGLPIGVLCCLGVTLVVMALGGVSGLT